MFARLTRLSVPVHYSPCPVGRRRSLLHGHAAPSPTRPSSTARMRPLPMRPRYRHGPGGDRCGGAHHARVHRVQRTDRYHHRVSHTRPHGGRRTGRRGGHDDPDVRRFPGWSNGRVYDITLDMTLASSYNPSYLNNATNLGSTATRRRRCFRPSRTEGLRQHPFHQLHRRGNPRLPAGRSPAGGTEHMGEGQGAVSLIEK